MLIRICGPVIAFRNLEDRFAGGKNLVLINTVRYIHMMHYIAKSARRSLRCNSQGGRVLIRHHPWMEALRSREMQHSQKWVNGSARDYNIIPNCEETYKSNDLRVTVKGQYYRYVILLGFAVPNEVGPVVSDGSADGEVNERVFGTRRSGLTASSS